MGLFIPSVMLLLAFPCAISHVVDSFQKCATFFKGSQPPQINGILKDLKSLDENYKLICQRYKSTYTYATLYDTARRIPVFSAYTYMGKGDFKREEVTSRWMIEPQLEPYMIKPDEMITGLYHQATDNDYKQSKKFDRGHLLPSSYAKDSLTARSTFTLTNIVPQYKNFNQHSWAQMEDKNLDFMKNNCRKNNNNIEANVLIGAVPANIRMNKRVSIPSMMWTAFCCYNAKNKSWISKAHWAPNEDEETGKKVVEEVKLEDLVKKLNEKKLDVTFLFENNCS